MSSDLEETAVLAKHVSKAYKLFDTPGKRLAYHLFHCRTGSDFTALDDVSFTVKKGEAFGIIGRNGSGKSTMLQILAGILKATSGEIKVNGRVAALLELGSGFDPESTGYENIYMNAAILGVSKSQTAQKIEQILKFADIGDFARQPVKLYSSGMYVRLAFAVAIHVDADILLIDEALAVGDVFFRQKCYQRLEELKKEGKTIILVSHGMNEVEQFCDRALLLDQSKAVMLGDSKEAVKRYYLLEQQTEDIPADAFAGKQKDGTDLPKTNAAQFQNGWSLKEAVFFDLSNAKEISNGKAAVVKVGAFDEHGYAKSSFEQGEMCYLYYEIEVRADIGLPLTGIVLTNQKGIIVHGKDNLQIYAELPDHVKAGTRLRCLQTVKLDLQVGEYTIEAGCATIQRELYEVRMYRQQEEVNAGMERLATLIRAGRIAVLEKKTGMPMKNMFHGICGLEGDIFICEES
ncbi:MAG: ABC transporter ATP-binding protein [Eubacterium sp.]|nr:ABC transporter ATP-binding protein [Eubacterium sp.]